MIIDKEKFLPNRLDLVTYGLVSSWETDIFRGGEQKEEVLNCLNVASFSPKERDRLIVAIVTGQLPIITRVRREQS